MIRKINDIDELIGKCLAGEASAQERGLLESWINESAENRNYFHQFQTIFEKAATVRAAASFDTDEAWTKVKAQLKSKSNGRSLALETSTLSLNFILRIAAGLIFILGVGYMGYRIFSTSKAGAREFITANTTEVDSLFEGTTVVLNRQSRINYVFDQASNTHTVKLNGEAFFDVDSPAETAFIVEANGVFIRDIGTSFNVKAYPDQNTIEVVVKEGEVMFFTKADPGVRIVKNQKGVFDKSLGAFTVHVASPNATAYKDRTFVFANTDLRTVVTDLNEVYEKRIVISENLVNCRVTVTFRNEGIDEIAAVIAETLGLQLKVTARNIMLEGDACER